MSSSPSYRFLRHPGYAGNFYAMFGVVLALDSWWTLLPTLFAIIIFIIRTALEDRTLLHELAGYDEYSARVRYRLIPGIW